MKKVINQQRRLAQSVSIATIIASLMVSAGVRAGDHWLSRVEIKRADQSSIVLPSSQAKSLSTTATTSTIAEFDIVISLDSNPQGDDNYKAKGTNDAQQRAYEERIEEFAKAVYQATNGGHKIRKVSIFRSKPGDKRVDSADVRWDENCAADQGPRADPSGFGVAGKRIWMCTNWPGAATLMQTAKGGGYTLAHEWGHFTYGLYDEYAQEQCPWALRLLSLCTLLAPASPRSSDTQAIPSIMNSQWVAARGTVPAGYSGSAADFLEYSTQNIHPYRSDSTGTNAQKRVFEKSAWQTLTSDPATDPKFSWLPTRTQYTILTGPTDPNWIVNNDESTALSLLDIRWVGNQVMDLSIDISGSMYGTPLANAKTGANLLIDQIQAGTAIGVSSFETDVVRNFAITDIPNPDTGIKAAAKVAVNALSTNNWTSLYDGLMFSLNDIKAFSSNRPGVVYVLSDGGDNDSTATESSVISAYKAAGVPIVAFAYGSFAPTGTLLNMANETGGAFYQSPSTMVDIQKALVEAEARFSSNVLLSSAQESAAGIATTTRIIPMDSTLASARINLSYTGSQTDFEFRLLSPSGINTGAIFVCNGAASCSTTLDGSFFTAFGHGDYQIQMVNKRGTQKDVTVLVSATPSGAETYDIAVGFSSNPVNYPADMAIRATVTKGPAIAGLDVMAVVTGTTGDIFNLRLLDDGKGADRVANDGTYSSSIPYTEDGIYSAVVTASNTAGKAQTTFEGVNISLREDGTAVIPTTTPISENFVRVSTASASVANFKADDHADNPAGGACTEINDNNADTVGRMDVAGDADCFKFTPSPTSVPTVLRVTSLTSGMNPVLTIYDHTGTVQIRQVNMSTSKNPSSGAIAVLAAANLDSAGVVFVVQHVDSTAATGGYAVSVGKPLTSDNIQPVTECLFNWAEKNYSSLLAPSGSATKIWTVYTYRYYAETNAYLGVNSVNNHLYYLGSDGVLQDVGSLADWAPKANCEVPPTPPQGECLSNWAERNYPTLFAPSGSPWAISSIDWTYHYYSETNTYLGIKSSDNHVYYMGADGQPQDEGQLSDWLPLAGCQ